MILHLVAGLALLLLGAEGLVRGASGLAKRLRIPPLLVGLTLVAFGTSAPEIVVTVRATLAGSPGVAMGNVVGSNIFNVLFILGAAALVRSLKVSRAVVRRDVPLLVAISLLVWGLSWNGVISTGEGVVLLVLAGAYSLHLVGAGIREGLNGPPRGEAADRARGHSIGIDLVLVVSGTVGLLWGAGWLVLGAVELAELLGAPDHLVGLTIVATGTSLPEVATSLTAGLRGRGDLAVGNIVGSNLYNLLLVLGAGAALAPGGLPVVDSLLRFDVPLMLGAAIALLPFAATGHRIDRWEGAVFLLYWVGYTTLLVLEAMGHPAREQGWILFAVFLAPLTLMTLGVCGVRILKARRSTGGERAEA